MTSLSDLALKLCAAHVQVLKLKQLLTDAEDELTTCTHELQHALWSDLTQQPTFAGVEANVTAELATSLTKVAAQTGKILLPAPPQIIIDAGDPEAQAAAVECIRRAASRTSPQQPLTVAPPQGFNDHDMVETITAVPMDTGCNIPAGARGTVVHRYIGGTTYEVEFRLRGETRVRMVAANNLKPPAPTPVDAMATIIKGATSDAVAKASVQPHLIPNALTLAVLVRAYYAIIREEELAPHERSTPYQDALSWLTRQGLITLHISERFDERRESKDTWWTITVAGKAHIDRILDNQPADA